MPEFSVLGQAVLDGFEEALNNFEHLTLLRDVSVSAAKITVNKQIKQLYKLGYLTTDEGLRLLEKVHLS